MVATKSRTRVRQPKTSKGKKHIAEREPSLVEPLKKCVFIKGKTCNPLITSILNDLSKLKYPTPLFLKHNQSKPFNDNTTLDLLMRKGNFSLFVYGSSNKKNPNLLTIGRYFDDSLLDMFEFQILNYNSINDIATSGNKINQLLNSIPSGSSSILSFTNFNVENNKLNRIKNLFVDLFNNGRQDIVIVSDIAYLIQFTCVSIDDLMINIGVYKVTFNGNIKQTSPPIVNLQELGPFLDIKIINTHFAEYELLKDAIKQPKSLISHKPKNVKNIEKDDAGGMIGKIHLEHQDLSKIKTKRVKALKRNAIAKVNE